MKLRSHKALLLCNLDTFAAANKLVDAGSACDILSGNNQPIDNAAHRWTVSGRRNLVLLVESGARGREEPHQFASLLLKN